MHCNKPSRLHTEPIPLSLYIHTPWCTQKCPYCDFNSHALKAPLPETAYINALIEDFRLSLPLVQDRPIISIFIGGGTPSLFSPSAIDHLLTEIQREATFQSDIEITLEANPGSVEQTRFQGFLAAGINRLSMGIQSFNALHLKKLGRVHNSLEAEKAIEAAYLAGFKRVNLDIMYGLPEQTVSQALTDIQTAIAFNPEHISWYQLTLEPNTPFYHHPPTLPHDEACWEMMKIGQDHLQGHGYTQYEVSAYTKPGGACRHNLNYWEFGDYLGIGAGACSKMTDRHTHTVQRSLKQKHPKQYLDLNQPFIAHSENVSACDLPLEFMMNALRLRQPIAIQLFEQRTGLPIQVIQAPLKAAINAGWLTLQQDHIQLTQQGYLFLNDVTALFMDFAMQ